MRFAMLRRTKIAVVAAAVLMVLAACSIQAPNVTLTGSGGGGSGTGGTGFGTTTGTGGTSTGSGTSGTAGTGTGTLPNANDTSCVGKATDTGVTGSEIKLGSTFAATGPVSSISGPIFYGVQSYFDKVNANGGVFGRKINYVTYDDGWDAQKGKAFIKKLVEQDRVFILSVVPSSNGLDAAKNYLESRHMPVIGSSGLIESQFQSPMQWPVGTSTKSATRILLLKMSQLGVRNAAIIWLDLLAGQEAYDAFREGIPSVLHKSVDAFMSGQARVSISGENYQSVWSNIAEQVSTWQSNNHETVTGVPDFVYFAIDPTSAISAIQAAQSKAYSPVHGWGGGQPLYLSVIAQQGYARATHLIAGSSYYPPQLTQIPAVRDYVSTVRHYYGSSVDVTNPFLEGGYVGAALTIEAIRRVGSCLTKDKVIKVANNFNGFSPAGLTRPLTYTGTSDTNFDHHGNYSYLWAQLGSNGTWVVDPHWQIDPTPGK